MIYGPGEPKFLDVVLREYGCTRCQRWHREGCDELFEAHLMSQSKHGVREVDVYNAIVEAFACVSPARASEQ